LLEQQVTTVQAVGLIRNKIQIVIGSVEIAFSSKRQRNQTVFPVLVNRITRVSRRAPFQAAIANALVFSRLVW
jgi:hypothetical protein